MKIDNSYKPNLAPLTNRQPASTPTPAGSTGEAVNLSAVANTLQGGEKPPVNSVRIQEIKDAIAQGRFKINPEAIADGLIESARNLIDSQRRA